MNFSKVTRELAIQKLQERELDLLIIGGGITGAGVAIQAAASGMETGLIEMQDFSEGTSSRSTKLVHGGIRYLKQFDVEVVNDTVSERAVVQQIAPHIPKATQMLLPVYDEEGSTFTMFRLKVAMDLYDLLAGVNNTEYANKVLTKEEVLEKAPHLEAEGLLGGGQYLDYTNSDVRLVIENIKRANQDGALIASRVKAVDYTYDGEKVNGVVAEDVLTGEQFTIRARVVINTTGPWSDETRNLGKEEAEQVHQMRPTKGVHLVVDESILKVDQPIYFDSGYHDGRMIFVLPREKKTYFGTTDTDYTGDYKHPTVEQEDVDYLIGAVNNRFKDAHITLDDIESSWAGLRPLIAGNSSSDYNGGDSGKLADKSFDQLINSVKAYLDGENSREDVEKVVANVEGTLSEQELDPSQVSRGSSLEIDDNGLLTLAGGKITDYRKMAEGALKKIAEILDKDYSRQFRLVNSKTYAVSGGEFNPENADEEIEAYAQIGVSRGFSLDDARYIAGLYGSNAPQVFNTELAKEENSGLTTVERLSLQYALDYEMALTPADYFIRRTNYMLFMRERLDHLVEPVVNKMADYLGWSEEEKQVQLEEFQKILSENDLENLKN